MTDDRRDPQKKFDGFDSPAGRWNVRASVRPFSGSGSSADPQAREGSRIDLRAVYREHHGLVWRSLRGLGVPEHAVEDAVQDVFMVVHRRRADYDGRVSVRRWVLGIARNVALKVRERVARQLARVEPVEHEPPSKDAMEPDERVARGQAAAFVGRFLEALDPDKRAVFVLIDVEGLTAPEAAELLGLKLNTVYSRLRTVRQRFERALARRHSKGAGPWNR